MCDVTKFAPSCGEPGSSIRMTSQKTFCDSNETRLMDMEFAFKMTECIFFNWILQCIRTLKEISDVMVNPCVMTGSSSAVRPFHTSNSTQRQPARSTCLYISTEELPASWPAKTQRNKTRHYDRLNYKPTSLSTTSVIMKNTRMLDVLIKRF